MTTTIVLASATSSIIFPIILVLAVVAMLVLPTISQKKQMKQFNDLINNLKVGDQISTRTGIIGKVTKINHKEFGITIYVETGDKKNKSTMEFDIGAVARVLRSAGGGNVPQQVDAAPAGTGEEITAEEIKVLNEAKPTEKKAVKPASPAKKTRKQASPAKKVAKPAVSAKKPKAKDQTSTKA